MIFSAVFASSISAQSSNKTAKNFSCIPLSVHLLLVSIHEVIQYTLRVESTLAEISEIVYYEVQVEIVIMIEALKINYKDLFEFLSP